MNTLFARLIPFIFMGIMLVVFIAGLIIFSYLLIFGALVGIALFIIVWIKETFFPSKQISAKSKRSPQTFDHDKK